MTDLRTLAEAARDSLARDGTSWWDAMRYIASDEEQDFATLCSPDRILALLAEVDRLRTGMGALYGFEAGIADERARIRAAVEGLPTEWCQRVTSTGSMTVSVSMVDAVDRAAVLAAIDGETT